MENVDTTAACLGELPDGQHEVPRSHEARFWRTPGFWILLILGLASVCYRSWELTVETGPVYCNSDEGHHTIDAVQYVLAQDPFADSYNPSTLFPVFSAIKVVGFWLFGANEFGLRFPSVLAMTGMSVLLAWLAWRHGSWFAGLLTFGLMQSSFLYHVYARVGTHESILLLTTSLAIAVMLWALRTQRTALFVLAGVLVALPPFVKTTGISVGPVALGLAFLAWWKWRDWWNRRLGLAVLSAGLTMALIVGGWMLPHWTDMLICLRGAYHPGMSIGESIRTFCIGFWQISPVWTLAIPVALVGLIYRWRATTRVDQALLVAMVLWLVGSSAILLYSSYKPARFYLWCLTPLAVLIALGVESLVRRLPRAQWRPTALAVVLVLMLGATLYRQVPLFQASLTTVRYAFLETTAALTPYVAGETLRGSGVARYSLAWSDVLIDLDIAAEPTCDELAALSLADRPHLISAFIGDVPARIVAAGVEDRFIATANSLASPCEDFSADYRPYLLVPQNPFGNTWNVWLIRKDLPGIPTAPMHEQLRRAAEQDWAPFVPRDEQVLTIP